MFPYVNFSRILGFPSKELASDAEVSAVVKAAVVSWERQVSEVVEEHTAKVPTGTGPLNEIDFWRERTAALRLNVVAVVVFLLFLLFCH